MDSHGLGVGPRRWGTIRRAVRLSSDYDWAETGQLPAIVISLYLHRQMVGRSRIKYPCDTYFEESPGSSGQAAR